MTTRISATWHILTKKKPEPTKVWDVDSEDDGLSSEADWLRVLINVISRNFPVIVLMSALVM